MIHVGTRVILCDRVNRSAHLIHRRTQHTMSYADLHLDAKTVIARTSISAWNALMRADPIFGRYALSDAGRSAFLAAFTVAEGGTWRVGGKLHRIDGQPARTCADGTLEWYERGQRHRIGGPAVIYACRINMWYEHGELHRAGGQPAVVCSSGTTMWYEHGELHRIGGPARIYSDGAEEWYERGRLHRIGGPACTYADGGTEWYERGQARGSVRPT